MLNPFWSLYDINSSIRRVWSRQSMTPQRDTTGTTEHQQSEETKADRHQRLGSAFGLAR